MSLIAVVIAEAELWNAVAHWPPLQAELGRARKSAALFGFCLIGCALQRRRVPRMPNASREQRHLQIGEDVLRFRQYVPVKRHGGVSAPRLPEGNHGLREWVFIPQGRAV